MTAPRKPAAPFWASFFTLIGVLTLCALGAWQVERLRWKTEIIEAITTAHERGPRDGWTRETIMALEKTPPVFTYAKLRGTYLFDAELYIGPRTENGKPGYHVITPLFLSDKSGWVLVNRGWVGLDHRADYTRTMKRQVYSVTGMIRAMPQGNPFTPPNQPDKQQWYKVDAKAIAEQAGIDGLIETLMLYAEYQTPEIAGPQGFRGHALPNNNHLSYAIFWFSLAAALGIIFRLRFRG